MTLQHNAVILTSMWLKTDDCSFREILFIFWNDNNMFYSVALEKVPVDENQKEQILQKLVALLEEQAAVFNKKVHMQQRVTA